MDAFIHATAATKELSRCQPPTTTHGWHFCSTVLPSRTLRNSLETKDDASFYPSQNPREQCRGAWQNYRPKTEEVAA